MKNSEKHVFTSSQFLLKNKDKNQKLIEQTQKMKIKMKFKETKANPEKMTISSVFVDWCHTFLHLELPFIFCSYFPWKSVSLMFLFSSGLKDD